MWPCPLRSKDAVVAPSLSRSLYSPRELVVFPFVTIFFFYDSFFSPLFPFHFRHVFGSLAVCPRGTQAAPPLSVALGGRGEERGGSAAGLMPAAPRPRGQPEKEAGSVAKVGHQQPRGMAGAERQEHRNASVPAPVQSLVQPLSCLGCPGEPQRAMAAWGVSPVGGRCWRSPGPSPCSFPCAWPAQLPGPGRVASRKAAKLEEGTPTPSLGLWACDVPGVLPGPRLLLVSLSRRRKSR